MGQPPAVSHDDPVEHKGADPVGQVESPQQPRKAVKPRRAHARGKASTRRRVRSRSKSKKPAVPPPPPVEAPVEKKAVPDEMTVPLVPLTPITPDYF
ncbi:MAG: hypothetical protein ABIJ96_01720 [Elusimicrobiota bacterium]